MNAGAMRPPNRHEPRGQDITAAQLQDLLRRDAAIATEWLVRRRSRRYADDLAAQRKRALAYIEWCVAASEALERGGPFDYADFVREWRMQAIRSDIRDLPHRFAWVFAAQILLAISVILFVAGVPLVAIPLLAGAVFSALHIYLAVPPVVVGPDGAKLPQTAGDSGVPRP
ncbi:hypothetical protein ABQF17_00580 [Mycolicibacterium elephantis]|uniref:Uncharacterized protein n=1 Tax=Mycolicibacterium elephantis TaxID=81858 RepID=A0A0M2ZL46_9MYCO|nr:hypothetical protein [Mycolicibacterium elephantis]KKW64573.1 hypothetical protein AAV95_11385 [Mycolicibacterium elephantis]OBB27979.1 hypothetical protein A5762_04790 [Mycolicibacterium elephantis]OBE96508.1 hypothetical protein A5776_19320 [Mycolicibacterium elephantis]ORA65780.1 hypothetical protein BST23_12255 [Mycolicibacterium elephantis]